MDNAEQDAFLREPRIAKLVTLREDGSPTVQPVWFEWDGTTAAIFTTGTTGKVARIRKDPRVALSVERAMGEPEAWVTIEGTAAIEDQGGWDLALRLFPRYYSPEKVAETKPQWEQVKDQFVVIRITPTRITSGS